MCLNGRSTIGRGDQPGVAGQPGERVRRVAEHGLDAPPPAGALGLDRPTLLVRQAADLEQPVDVEAQARLGGQPAGRGVGRVEEAQLLQVRHHVADGRRGELVLQAPRDRARAHRLAGGDVGVDDLAEDLARAGVEFDDHRTRKVRAKGLR
jgi:hypothetical protein